ncbi:HNS binding protein [Enterobacter phage EcpYZU01]|uniref:HNS binding protein n=1 Tax=Enterobacter phage EcpYZU01 TaxID=2483604 RepID=UPI0018ACDE40|nr:HNS binding protein [Enterobacter phage EcpYZU01]
MAITKRIRVSFDLKMVVSSKEEETMCRNLAEMTKAYVEGEKLDGLQAALVKTAIESGPESALEIAVKKTIKEELVDAFDEDQFGVSNLRFEVKR